VTNEIHATYHNPVFRGSAPDPFVLKWCGVYWAYCTGETANGRRFPILRSTDLVAWETVGGALEPLPQGFPHYWAPEVTYDNGRFHMYYSTGDELNVMMVRVAVATHPAGPFMDAGVRLTAEEFAIDAHVFVDDDGARYLFYATDYLTHSHIGTGTAMAAMDGPLALDGPPRPVTRARFDWQVYDPQRAEKGGVRWHTVEGPFVLKRKGRYYQMFSGGNWQNPSYGVSYAVSDRIERPDEWAQHADGERLLPIIRTVPERVIGPGHNSVVRGPDNLQLFCVYHRWVEGVRAMAIDRLDWAGERMTTDGPSDEPRPLPHGPALADSFAEAELSPIWQVDGGDWRVADGEVRQEAPTGAGLLRCAAPAPAFVVEVSARGLNAERRAQSLEDDAQREQPQTSRSYGMGLDGADGPLLSLLLAPERGLAHVRWRAERGWLEEHLPLPAGFDGSTFHLLRAEVDGPQVRLSLDNGRLRWRGLCANAPSSVALRTHGGSAAFAGFALTVGWEDLFDGPESVAELGWLDEAGAWRIEGQALHCAPEALPARIVKGPELTSYEFVVSARLGGAGGYGFLPAAQPGHPYPLVAIEQVPGGWALVCHSDSGARRSLLPTSFDPHTPQLWRIRRAGEQISIAWESHPVCVMRTPAEPARVGLWASGAAAFDTVRVVGRDEG
jgi:GH43 family beta-xylosidase